MASFDSPNPETALPQRIPARLRWGWGLAAFGILMFTGLACLGWQIDNDDEETQVWVLPVAILNTSSPEMEQAAQRLAVQLGVPVIKAEKEMSGCRWLETTGTSELTGPRGIRLDDDGGTIRESIIRDLNMDINHLIDMGTREGKHLRLPRQIAVLTTHIYCGFGSSDSDADVPDSGTSAPPSDKD